MKLYCINLERSHDRRQKMQSEFNQAGLECEFISAIDGRRLSSLEIINAYSKWRTILRHGHPLSIGEIGCAMSHIEFFKRVSLGSEDTGFLFEDDIALKDGANVALTEVAEFLENTKMPTLVQLPGLSRDLPKASEVASKFIAVKSATGAYAYGINKSAAELLLRAFSPIKMPIDRYSYLIRHFGLYFCVYNRQVVEVDICSESTVGMDRFISFKGLWQGAYKLSRILGASLDALLSFREWKQWGARW